MTENEFHNKYHGYCVQDMKEATEEAEKVNKKAINFEVEPIHFPGLGIAIMVKKASEFIKELYPECKESK